jgi:hypothetical protein
MATQPPPDNTQPTYEEAKRCPRCQLPGEVVSRMPTAKPGTQVHTVYCRNEDCPWFNSMWIVQVNPDGSVPPPNTSSQEKLFPKLMAPPDEEQRVLRALQRQLDVETQPGGEVRNPRG